MRPHHSGQLLTLKLLGACALPRRWRQAVAHAAGIWLACICASPALAQSLGSGEDSKALAQSVPIADVHMHLTKGLTPAEVVAQMDRNGVRWGGAVGPLGPGIDPAPFAQALGERYIAAGAQPQFSKIYSDGGVSGMEDANSASFQQLLHAVEADFAAGRIHGIGELILVNMRSHPNPKFRRKAAPDAPTFMALYALADKHKGFVQLHVEDDRSSLNAVSAIATRFPDLPIILSHCLARGTASTARDLLSKHPNLYCETSARSEQILNTPAVASFVIHTNNGVNKDWLKLIEAMPDRFMVGSDNTGAYSYDGIMASVRSGLLAHLTEPTLKKVAYENAVRLFKLQDGAAAPSTSASAPAAVQPAPAASSAQ